MTKQTTVTVDNLEIRIDAGKIVRVAEELRNVANPDISETAPEGDLLEVKTWPDVYYSDVSDIDLLSCLFCASDDCAEVKGRDVVTAHPTDDYDGLRLPQNDLVVCSDCAESLADELDDYIDANMADVLVDAL